jgi:hypothetical protein
VKSILPYRRTALVLLGIWTLVGLAFSGVELLGMSSEGRPVAVLSTVLGSLMRAYIWGALSPLVYVAARRYPIDPRDLAWRPIAANLWLGLALSFLYPWIGVVLVRIITPKQFAAYPSLWSLLTRQIVIYTWYTFISFYAPTFFAVQALLLLRRYRDEEAKNAALQAEVSRAQLSALKMQLHPHFLFNALHAVSSLVLVDPGRANKMVALLGDFLRQTLDHSNDQIVTLEAELGFLRNYLEIEETRFEDRLTVRFEIEPATLAATVPHLIMQPLVENAVKHGIAPFAAPGRILISARREASQLALQVIDSGSDAGTGTRSCTAPKNGVGIANVRSRLAHIYGDSASLTIADLPQGGCQVDLKLPFGVDRNEPEDQ